MIPTAKFTSELRSWDIAARWGVTCGSFPASLALAFVSCISKPPAQASVGTCFQDLDSVGITLPLLRIARSSLLPQHSLMAQ